MKWLQEKVAKAWTGLTDDKKIKLDRRLFLQGATVTTAGLILPVPIIIAPTPPKPKMRMITVLVPPKPDDLDVFYNGSLLRHGSDYRVGSNGTLDFLFSQKSGDIVVKMKHSKSAEGLWVPPEKEFVLVEESVEFLDVKDLMTL